MRKIHCEDIEEILKQDRFKLNDYHKAWIARRQKTMAESTPISFKEACENMRPGMPRSTKDKSAMKS